MNPEIVRHGFLMTRTLEGTRAHYNKLVAAGRIDTSGAGKHKAKSKERMGITKEPILEYKDPMHHICPLHCELHGLDWWEEFIITHNARDEWPNKTPYRRSGVTMTQGQRAAMCCKIA